MRNIRCLFLTAAFALAACATAQLTDDRSAIEAILRADHTRIVAAWEARDAAMMFPEATDVAVLVSPNGDSVDVAALRADLQRRMGMTVSVEEMSMKIVSIEVSGDGATAVTNQRFARTLNQPNGPRQRISTVTHTQ